MKKKLIVCILSLTGTIALAQSPAQQSVRIAVGGGASSTSSALKEHAGIGNGYQINGEIFIPLLNRNLGESEKGNQNFALGIIAGGTYQSAKNLIPDGSSIVSQYKLYSDDLELLSAQKGSSRSRGFTGSGGLQVDFTFGKFTLSPSISAAYFTLRQHGFTQSSQVMVNGTTQTVVLLESPQEKRSGWITRPQFKVSYPLTGQLSFYAAGTLNLGPTITSQQSQLVPSGGFNAKNTYEATQLTTGTRAIQTVEARYQTLAVHAGLSWSFGPCNNAHRHLKGKITRPGDGGMRGGQAQSRASNDEKRTYTAGRKNEISALVAGNPIGGIIVKGGKNPGGSMMTMTSNGQGEFELKGLEAGDYKFTITAAEEPAGKSISEKGVSSTKGRPKNIVFSPGSPIGGIVVKGGKNPGGNMIVITTNDQGEFEFKGLEAGDYKFKVIAPHQPAKGHSEKGIK